MGYVGIEEDYYVSVKSELDITAETGALTTQFRIKELTPADVAPVVYGRWIRHWKARDTLWGYCEDMFKCSKCGAWKEDDSDFCPDCGAIMYEEEE